MVLRIEAGKERRVETDLIFPIVFGYGKSSEQYSDICDGDII